MDKKQQKRVSFSDIANNAKLKDKVSTVTNQNPNEEEEKGGEENIIEPLTNRDRSFKGSKSFQNVISEVISSDEGKLFPTRLYKGNHKILKEISDCTDMGMEKLANNIIADFIGKNKKDIRELIRQKYEQSIGDL